MPQQEKGKLSSSTEQRHLGSAPDETRSWALWILPNWLLPTWGILIFQSFNKRLNQNYFYEDFLQCFRSSESVNHTKIQLQCYAWPPKKCKSWYTSPCQIPYFPSDLPLASTEKILPEAWGSCKSSILDIFIHHFTMTSLKIVWLFAKVKSENTNPRILLLKFIRHFLFCITYILHGYNHVKSYFFGRLFGIFDFFKKDKKHKSTGDR